MPDFLDDIEKAKRHFEKIEGEFRAELEKPEWKEAIEKGKLDHAYTTSTPRGEQKREETKWEQALLTPEAGLIAGIGVIALYMFFARRK